MRYTPKTPTKKQRIPVSKVILGVVAVAGILAVTAVAPNALKLIENIPGFSRRRYTMRDAVQRLVKNGSLSYVRKDGHTFLELSKKGKRDLARYRTMEDLCEPKRWDGKWRIVIFDIKESYRWSRDHLRRELASFGFVRLQNSVWVYPYDVEEVVSLIKVDLKLGSKVLHVTAERIENDTKLRQLFSLPQC
ncbi:MAG: CRISPR-associated endonuclease Cas2 [Candidatus Vogelbacteria bacterium]|nr:CRISPR-associated endonuclease Cas2 [Candidatus Vogelbacteria bacterium]